MKELDLNFENGYGSFKQIDKSPYCFIYERLFENNIYYEVFERKEQQESSIERDGVVIALKPKVKYPKDEAFGTWAWCYGNKDKAINKFNEINNEKINKSNQTES